MNYKIYWRNPDSTENHLVHASNARDPALHVSEPTLVQTVNSHGSLSFKVLSTNPEYGSIRELMTIVTVYDGDDLIFRGRVIETTQDIGGIISVYCEGELAFLCDSIHTPFVYGGSTATPGDLFRRLIANHNAYTTSVDNSNREKLFTVGQVTIPARKGYTYSADTAQSTWDLLIDGLINQVGGYIRTRHADDGTTYIDYLADYTQAAQQTVEYGKNLLSLSDSVEGGDIITVLLPYGGKAEGSDVRTTIESVNNGKAYIKADDATIKKYRNVWGTQTWDDITDPGVLLSTAQAYLNAQKEALNTVSAKALDLSAVDSSTRPIYVGDYVRVISAPHGIDKRLLCTEKTTDLSDPAGTEITLGPTVRTLTAAVKNGDAAIRSSVAAASAVSGVASKALSDAGSAAADASNAKSIAESAKAAAAEALIAAEGAATDAAEKAPKSHASTQTTYGLGSEANYGHVKLSDAASGTQNAAGGVAATPTAVKKAYDRAGVAASAASEAATMAANAGDDAAAAAELAQSASDDAAAALTAAQGAQTAVAGKAPTSHASGATTYGKGSTSYYGHVKLSDATDSTLSAASGGTAATPAAVKAAYDLANQAGEVATAASETAQNAANDAAEALSGVNGKAPTSHASGATTYGAGNSTMYGHVKLSASTSSTSGVSGGVAATPSAVKSAYDLAKKAATTLLGDKKIVCGWSAISFKNTGQTNTTISFGTTFTAKPTVIIGQPFNGVICTVFNDAVTTTGFTVNVPAVGSSSVSTRQMAWIAIGSV